jgi:hypothetical protein
VLDPSRVGESGQLGRAGQILGGRFLGVDVPAGLDRGPDRLLPLRGRLGVEVDLHIGPVERFDQVGGPLCQAVPVRDLAELGLVAADEHRLGPQPVAAAQRQAALCADGEQAADQMLPVPHAARHAVEHDPDRSAGHAHSLGKRFPGRAY